MMRDMTAGAPWKIILSFSVPLMAGNLLQQLYHTADTLIVGNLVGERALSAVGSCASLTELFTALAIGFSIGAGVLAAQCCGAAQEERLRKYASTAICLMTGMGIAVSLTGLLAGEFILKNVLQVPETMLGLAASYFRIYALGLVFQFGYNIFAAILQAVGDSSSILYFLLLSSAVNILLDLLFVRIWGVAGAAAATGISQLCACAAGGIYMNRKYRALRFQLRELSFEPCKAFDVLRVGMPMALQYSVISVGILILQRLVNTYGQAMIASFTVVVRLQGFLTIPIKGFQSTMTTYAGQNMGAGKKERIPAGLWQAVGMSLGITIALAAAVYSFMDPLVQGFGIDSAAAQICVRHLRVMVPSILMYAAYFPMNGMLQGVGDGAHATACALLALALRILFSYTLSTVEYWGYTAVWWSETYAWFIVLAVYYIYYFRGNWRNKALIS